MASDKANMGTPQTVLILGGGRWAKSIAGGVLKIVSIRTRIIVCSPRGAEEIRRWVRQCNLGARIEVLAQRPAKRYVGITAVIVANAARSHFQSVFWAISFAEAILVEKPFALTRRQVQQLTVEADRLERFLAPAQVFLFCRYFHAYANCLTRSGSVKHVRLEWLDESAEHRYGENKKYDSSIPVFSDVLPHLLSVLNVLFGQIPDKASLTEVRRGGSEVVLRLFMDDFHCDVVVARNAEMRCRRLLVTHQQLETSLDWSVEPGMINDGTGQYNADELWSENPSPMTQLLSCFLQALNEAQPDPRFDMESTLKAASLNEIIYPQYLKTLIKIMADEISKLNGNIGVASEHIRYGLNELVQSGGSITRDDAPGVAKRLLEECLTMQEAQIRAQLYDLANADLSTGQWPENLSSVLGELHQNA